MRGYLDYWHQGRGFGFIRTSIPGEKFFVHITGFNPALPAGMQLLKGLTVSFEEGQSSRGPIAINVRVEPGTSDRLSRLQDAGPARAKAANANEVSALNAATGLGGVS